MSASLTLPRRRFLRLGAAAGAALGLPWASGCGDRATSADRVDPRRSPYGRWIEQDGLPAFAYDADQDALAFAAWDPLLAPTTRRHWVMLGNRAIRLQAANDGAVGILDETEGLRWIIAPDPTGSGESIVEEGGARWGSAWRRRAGERTPLRTFGPASFTVTDALRGLTLERTVLCPEGEVPWLLIRVRLTLAAGAAARAIRHVERWALAPRFLNLLESEQRRRQVAAAAVAYDVAPGTHGLVARERFVVPTDDPALASAVFGPPLTLVLEALGDTAGSARVAEGDAASPHPALEIASDLRLDPGADVVLWFRFGRDDGTPPSDPAALFADTTTSLARRLPRASTHDAPEAAHEIPWHAAMLEGGLAIDRVIGGHSLDQGSAYAYVMGFNGAARDPLQHALPLVYSSPQLALSVLRNTCAWATPEGDLPYALDGAKRPTNIVFRPSDQNLWALWLAAEYAAATGDLAAFDEPLAYHPSRRAEPVPLREHLRRQLRFFSDVVGRGERGHVRILNADWNDLAIDDSGVDRDVMIERGGSVLNSAMAAWVLPVFAGLAERLGERTLAAEARAQGEELRLLVAEAWNGRWFHRAYAPGVAPVGDDDCWLEVQPWAILCGAADARQARALLDTIDAGHRAGSPLGARLRWPAPEDLVRAGSWGQGTRGGIWYAIDMTLVWAAARSGHALARDEWRRMTLGAHTAAYPEVWEGTLSGPDAWNAPESPRAGRTWAADGFAMQAFPVANMHSHAQPLLAYVRLLGIEPTARGTLAVGSGGDFSSSTFTLEASGHGTLNALGAVDVESSHGTVRGGPGRVRW
ncbi:hypothetical protein K2Z84_09410 [Candidatus Binatia bacterium]|nr:hypothetical protein [Candidatus Binatia bacterium]